MCGEDTILVVEDDKTLRELSQIVLESSGYHVIPASDGQEALHLFKTNIDTIQLVILDVVMPFVSGPEVCAQMLALRPNLPVILTTGHVPESVSLNFRIAADALFIQKPYTIQELKNTIRIALDRAK